MGLFSKRYLLLSSVLFLVLVSCRISKYKHHSECNRVVITDAAFPPVLTINKATKFKATLDVLKNHLSGIMIVKKTDSLSTHIVYVTELGMKLFDFEWKENKMNVAYIFEPLNKPSLIKSLLNNFKTIFLLDVLNKPAGLCNSKGSKPRYELEGYKHRYLIADSLKGLSEQAVFSHNRKSSLINYTYNTVTKKYSQIKCIQYGLVKIHIELNEITFTND